MVTDGNVVVGSHVANTTSRLRAVKPKSVAASVGVVQSVRYSLDGSMQLVSDIVAY